MRNMNSKSIPARRAKKVLDNKYCQGLFALLHDECECVFNLQQQAL